MERITAKEYKDKYQHQTFFKKNKYNAKKVLLDGKKFDSASEGDYYSELLLQKRAGLIQDIELQAKEELWAYGEHIGNYYVDFKVIHNDGSVEFIEHKGVATDLWKWKFKMLKAKYKNDKNVKISVNYYNKKRVRKIK